jgi:hypothetical protein
MKNILLNYDYYDMFELIVSSGLFDEYESLLDEDDYNNLLNSVSHFASTLSVTITRKQL